MIQGNKSIYNRHIYNGQAEQDGIVTPNLISCQQFWVRYL